MVLPGKSSGLRRSSSRFTRLELGLENVVIQESSIRYSLLQEAPIESAGEKGHRLLRMASLGSSSRGLRKHRQLHLRKRL